MGVWVSGLDLICYTDILSGYRVILTISDACAGRRRHQAVFHDRMYLEPEDFMLLYGLFICNGGGHFFDKAVVSKKSFCASDLFFSIHWEVPEGKKYTNLLGTV